MEIEDILDKYSAKLIRIMRLEKNVEDAIIESDLLQMKATQEIKELIKAKLPKEKVYNDRDFEPTHVRNIGYNQCLSEVIKIVEEL